MMNACMLAMPMPVLNWRCAPEAVHPDLGMADAQNLVRQVRCPACGGPSIFGSSNAYRPFCSERCKNLDLGAWANEQFRVEADAPPEDLPYGDPKLLS